MTVPAPDPVAAPSVPASVRVRLAHAAMEAALAVDGVVAGHGGPVGRHATFDRTGPLVGVTAAAAAPDGYDVSLRLVARPVPLHLLAGRVRAAIDRRARRLGLAAQLRAIDVRFEDLEETS